MSITGAVPCRTYNLGVVVDEPGASVIETVNSIESYVSPATCSVEKTGAGIPSTILSYANNLAVVVGIGQTPITAEASEVYISPAASRVKEAGTVRMTGSTW